MPRKKTTDFDEYKYQQEYIKKNLKFVNVPFNSKFPDELKLYDYLNEHAKDTGEKKGTFIKRLIREYMDKEERYKEQKVVSGSDPRELFTPDVVRFVNDDISFCPIECDKLDCMRNCKNIVDKTVPHSYFLETPADCPKK